MRSQAVERVLNLENEGWGVSPNFHFGFMAKGLCWTDAKVGVVEYVKYWQECIGRTVQIERSGWDEYWRELLKQNMATPGDREQFDRDFTNTSRASAAPRPGISCTFGWRLDEAERLDAGAQLRNVVRERVNELLQALGEDEINPMQD
jgi:hypothetical protein